MAIFEHDYATFAIGKMRFGEVSAEELRRGLEVQGEQVKIFASSPDCPLELVKAAARTSFQIARELERRQLSKEKHGFQDNG